MPENTQVEVTFPPLVTAAPGRPRLAVLEGICAAPDSYEVGSLFSVQHPYLGSWNNLESSWLPVTSHFDAVPHVHEMFWKKLSMTHHVSMSR